MSAVVRRRRSKRRYTTQPLALEELSALFHHAAQPPLLSTAVRAHIVINRVSGLSPGVYRYHPREHALSLTRSGDHAAKAGRAGLDQDVIANGAIVLILAADRADMFAYGARGYRHAFLEIGMFSERFLLAAVALGLGACPVGAFYDDDAADLIGVDMKDEWVMHFAAVGKP